MSRPAINDPIQLLDRSAREFLSRPDLDPRRRATTPAPSTTGYYAPTGHRSSSSSSSSYRPTSPSGNISSAIASHRTMSNMLPPISSRTTDRQRYAEEMGRPTTTVPSSQPIYPSNMLPHATSRSTSSYAPYSNHPEPDPRTNGGYHQPQPRHPTSTSPSASPPYTHSRSPLSSGSIGSPPPLSPVSSVSSSRHSHSQSRGYTSPSSPPLPQSSSFQSNSGSLTDVAPSSRLVPNRQHSRRTSHDVRQSSTSSSHHYSSSTSSSPSSSGYPRVGPALANNLPPVLPRPPNTSGGYAPRRSSTLGPAINGRSGRSVSTLRGIDDEDATIAVNTFHRA